MSLNGEQLLRAAAVHLGVTYHQVTVLMEREGRVVGRVVLPDGRDVVVKASATRDDFAAEAAAVHALSAADVPVARVLSLHAGPPSTVVLEWTPGRALHAGDEEEVRRQAVALLELVHRLPGTGRYGGVNGELATWIDGWCDHALTWWGTRAGTSADVTTARSWYRRVRPLVVGRNGSAILLDAVPDHFIVGPDARVRLIDVANLQPGDPVMDLAVLLLHSPEILTGVLAGYQQTEVRREHLRDLLPFYVFLRALAAAEWCADVLHDDDVRDRWLVRASGALDLETR